MKRKQSNLVEGPGSVVRLVEKAPEYFVQTGFEGVPYENAKAHLLEIASRGYYEADDVRKLPLLVCHPIHLGLQELGKHEDLPDLAKSQRLGVEFYPKDFKNLPAVTMFLYVLPEGVPASPDNNFAVS